MFTRTLRRGAIAATVIALIPAAPAIAGEDDPSPPPTNTQPVAPQPVPTTPAPVPTTPAPTPTPPQPAPKKHKAKRKHAQKHHVQVLATTTTPVTTTLTTASSDTGTVAQGGIQAGEGGMAQHGSDGAPLGVSAGLAAFVIAAGVHARRRRAFER